MLSRIRNSKLTRYFSAFLALELIITLIPSSALALTSGPSQPEVQSFEPIATTDMVDPFTGDFNYNVPLMQVGNYPINIFYHAGVGMDDEASCVGLGWNINPGNISRNMRGLPDDFLGDEILTEQKINPNTTYKVDYGLNLELLGLDPTNELDLAQTGIENNDNDASMLNLSIYYNNYRGLGYSVGASLTQGCFSTNLGFDSQSGFDVDLSLEADFNKKEKENYKPGASIGYNSRGGLGTLSLKHSFNTNLFRKASKTERKVAQGRGRGFATSLGSSISFTKATYSPSFTPWMYNTTISAGIKLGGESVGASYKSKIGLTVSSNYLKWKQSVHKGLGYLYSGSRDLLDDETVADDDYKYFGVMMDFNRDREPEMNKKTKWLHTTNFTYDVYSAAGQGVSGFFRPFRNSLGHVSDPDNKSNTLSNVGVIGELAGPPATFEFGADINIGTYNGSAKSWLKQGDHSTLLSSLDFTDVVDSDNPLDEPVYFKMAGEKSVNDATFYDKILDDKAIKIPLESYRKLQNKFVSGTEERVINGSKIKRTKRDKRSQNVTYLTAAEASRYGLEKKPKYYDSDGTTVKYLNRVDPVTGRKAHHISEIIVTNADGTRYVYGIAAYNTEQSEYSFSVPEDGSNPQNVPYDAEQASLNNNVGKEEYFKKQTTPPYAHTYLLTAVLSPDYIDISGDGPSEDDLGTYTKINYTKFHDKYKWRTPYNNVSYSRGMMSINKDDKGTIFYGEKEIWNVHSIESKTQVAKFIYSERNDGRASNGIGGGLGPQKLHKLDNITLFSKTDLIKNSSSPGGITPIKTVHFTYDYSLCEGVLNNDGLGDGTGKLTLLSFYFTYGKNTSGSLNKYDFTYGEAFDGGSVKNENYAEKRVDRWGNYKNDIESGGTTLRPWEYPYTDQSDINAANDLARMWNLTKIVLPSGGIIRPKYEADTYKYVQDQNAMTMVKVLGFNDDNTVDPDEDDNKMLYYTSGLEFNQNTYMRIKLPHAVSNDAELAEYIGDIRKLYFSLNINLADGAEPETITGFADVDVDVPQWYGLVSGSDDEAWIKVKLVEENGRDVNPFSIAAWQYMRNNRPDLAYPGSDLNTDGITLMDVANMITAHMQDLVGIIAGIRTKFMMNRNGQTVDLDQCFVRINCRKTGTNAGKIGGGYRISAIDFDDNWDAMTDEDEPVAKYGQEFIYKLQDGTTSGVAAYEPTVGGNENPLHMPLFSGTLNQTFGPDDRFYVEGPLGEQFYPSPTVGYSRVVIRNKKPQLPPDLPTGTNLQRHGSGKTVHEFYTAKDFPVISSNEPIDTRFSPNLGILNMLGVISFNWGTASQGFSITTNDMHGKPKSIAVYRETTEPDAITDDALISKTEYFYKQDGNKLVNDALAINKDGTIEEKNIGKEIEVVVDTKHKQDISINAGIKFNLDVFMLPLIPALVATGFPSFNYTQNDIRFATCTKIVQRYGILESTKVTENGSSLTTRNVLWDAETGEVLLTETQNEHNDNTYNFTLPAHWAYDNMGPAYQNVNATGTFTLTCATDATTMLAADNTNATMLANDIFVPGDEVMIMPSNVNSSLLPFLGVKAWVLDVDKTDGSEKISFIDEYGAPAIDVNTSNAGEYVLKYKILRSGRRNQQSLSVGSFISRKFPFISEGESVSYPMGKDLNSDNKIARSLSFNVNRAIINASAVEYSDKWQMFNGITYETASFYKCQQKDKYSVPNFFNQLIANNSLPNPSLHSFNVNTEDYSIDQFVSPNLLLENTDLRIGVFDEPTLRVTLSGGTTCEAFIYLKPLDDYEPFTINNDYFNNIVNFTGGGYITPAEKIYYDENTEGYYLLTAHTATGECIRFICYKLAENGSCVDFNLNYCGEVDDYATCNGDIDACAPALTGSQQVIKIINPYQRAVRGIWRPLRSYAYNSSRNYTGDYLSGTTQTNIRFDGTYKDFTPFWTPNSGNDWNSIAPGSLGSTRWVWTEEVTKVSPFGFDVENKDALGRYSGAVYGYLNSLPVITGGNAKYTELAFDGFEDYDFPQILLVKGACLPKDHFSFNDVVTSTDVVEDIAHTGKRSLKVVSGTPITAERDMKIDYDPALNSAFMSSYTIQKEDTLPLFSPREGKFVLSAWVKAPSTALEDVKIHVEVVDKDNDDILASADILALTSQPTIEGWKRMDGTFVIDAADIAGSANCKIKVTLVNTTGVDVYYDDLRIHPFNCNAKSYVYDPVKLRLVAQLDENNYATFYEYDDQGNLVRTKRETERGIMTIQENRQSIKKQ